jgi:hypothetical protein
VQVVGNLCDVSLAKGFVNKLALNLHVLTSILRHPIMALMIRLKSKQLNRSSGRGLETTGFSDEQLAILQKHGSLLRQAVSNLEAANRTRDQVLESIFYNPARL